MMGHDEEVWLYVVGEQAGSVASDLDFSFDVEITVTADHCHVLADRNVGVHHGIDL